MPYASGLSGQIGAVASPSYGDSATVVTHFYELLGENFVFNPNWLDGLGLKSGQAFKRGSRTVQSRFDVNGDLTMEHTSGEAANAAADSMGFWWKYALGSTLVTPTVVVGTAFKQVHTNGTKAGQYIACQVGRPQILSTTVQPFYFTGVKVTQWDFSCNDNQIAQLKVTFDGRTELTSVALAAASYPTPNGLFAFSNASVFTLGGTATTSAGETTIAGGTPIASLVNGITITGATPMKVAPSCTTSSRPVPASRCSWTSPSSTARGTTRTAPRPGRTPTGCPSSSRRSSSRPRPPTSRGPTCCPSRSGSRRSTTARARTLWCK